jgi:hypothetical protein
MDAPAAATLTAVSLVSVRVMLFLFSALVWRMTIPSSAAPPTQGKLDHSATICGTRRTPGDRPASAGRAAMGDTQ